MPLRDVLPALLGGLVAMLFATFAAGQPPTGVLQLVTEDEAGLFDAPDAGGSAEPAGPRSLQPSIPAPGPRIIIVSPDEGRLLPAPVTIDVRFVPEPQMEADLTTLRVEYVKLVAIDITDRVRPYVTPAGIRVEQAQLPSGRHTVRISLADRMGRSTSRSVTFRIQ